MAGVGDPLFDLITGSNPEQAIADWSNDQQRKNRAALGLDANGNPLPAAPAAAAAPPNADGSPSPGDQAAVQAQVASTIPPGQEPNATKTPQSLGALLMNLQQRNEADQGLNQALGMGFAAFAQPRDREMVSKLFNVDQPNVNQIGATQMNLGMQQQGQDRMNALGQMLTSNDPAMQAQAQKIADSLNIPLADLKARYLADPAGVGAMIQNFRQPTPQMQNLQQIQDLQNQIKSKTPGATSADLSLLTPALVAQVGGDVAGKAIGDAVSYRSTHGGKQAPWVGPGGVNVQAYNQWSKDQGTISDNQATAAVNLSSSLQATDTLRQKLTDLKTNPGLAKILNAPNDSPLKQAAWNAINDPDPNWQKNIVQTVLINDPQALQAISELKEINGQEYTSALHSLLGHGLRPSQTEVGAVREGFGQTKNVNLFGNIKDYTAQAINPLLTRLDEAQAEGYGASGQIQNAPARIQPFIDKTYLSGGKMHLDDGSAPQPWESQIHKPLTPDMAATLANQIKTEPGNAFYYRDKLRRQGYDVD
jgi:hypothetical protein